MSTPASTKISVFAVAILSALVVGCTNHQRAPKGFSEATVQPYRLDSGDRLRINVFEQASLSGSYTVDQAGYVAFPLIGAVPSRGHTLPELEGMIAAKLRQGFLKDPDGPSRSTATAPSSSWVRWARPANMPTFRA